jgi:hypothetical protein
MVVQRLTTGWWISSWEYADVRYGPKDAATAAFRGQRFRPSSWTGWTEVWTIRFGLRRSPQVTLGWMHSQAAQYTPIATAKRIVDEITISLSTGILGRARKTMIGSLA